VPHPVLTLLALLAAPASAGRATASVASAPAAAAARADVAGQVVDAGSGVPLEGAVVVLVPHPDGALAAGGVGDPFPASARRALTGADGRYRFAGLVPGAYRLHASRLGYAPSALDVTLGDGAPGVSLGLAVAPFALRAVPVHARASDAPRPADVRGGGAPTAARVRAAADRQARYLAPDVRELTPADVGDAVTLAESDLFRALHRLPGVSTRDEWTAELWTRGTRADQTRVLFDGLPLFGPFHAYGVLSAINADVVGAAFLHPGVRPAAIGEGGAAVLDVHTRAGSRGPARVDAAGDSVRAGAAATGSAELAVTSARAALGGASRDGGVAWRVAGRRSYLDAITRVRNGEPSYHFADAFARVDLRLGGGHALTVSALEQRDRVPTPPRSVSLGGFFADSQGAAWGDRVARVTHRVRLGGARPLLVEHTLGASAHEVDGMRLRGGFPALSRVGVGYGVLRGSVSPLAASADAHDGAAPAWSAGWEVARQSARYAGPGRRAFTGLGGAAGDTAIDGRVTVATLWGARRWHPASRLVVEPGLRLEFGAGRDADARLRAAPRVAARYTLDDRTLVSAAAGRSVQYAQALPTVEGADVARFQPVALWQVAGRDVPALTTDLATLGAERWLGGGWLGSVNAYARRAAGLVVHDPTPGLGADRRLFVVADERGQGVELSARRLVGRTTATFAYTYARSMLSAGGWRYASPQDRPHALDFTIAHRLTPRRRVALALSAASGAPFTRVVDRFVGDGSGLPSTVDEFTVSGNGNAYAGTVADVPNGGRRPPALGADLLYEWSRPIRGRPFAAWFQLHSPLALQSTGGYGGSGMCVVPAGSAPADVFGPAARCAPPWRAYEDTFVVIPVVGLRVAF
jgi:hypothetical protein